MKVKIEKNIGYLRLYLEINEELIGEIYVFIIDHPKKDRPYYLIDEFYGDKERIVDYSGNIGGFKGRRVGNLLLDSLINFAKEEQVSSIKLSENIRIETNDIFWGVNFHLGKYLSIK